MRTRPLRAGTLSALVGLAVCIAAVVAATGRIGGVVSAVASAGLVAGLALTRVIGERLSEIDPSSGLPRNWLVRLDNLRTYFWPELFSDFNWVLGVRPFPEAVGRWPLSGTVWIESGHTWPLWIGGVPLLSAFIWFVVAATRAVWPVARTRRDAFGVAAVEALPRYGSWQP
jgi:hypothetical protein